MQVFCSVLLAEKRECGVLRFSGELCLTSVMNADNQKHIRVERAMMADEQQRRDEDRLRAQCVRSLISRISDSHFPFHFCHT